MNDKEFLQWIHDRLQYIHHEPGNIDYMKRLQALIDALNEEAKNERAS
jgi:hypothetical protein